jgi:hypothetical protein
MKVTRFYSTNKGVNYFDEWGYPQIYNALSGLCDEDSFAIGADSYKFVGLVDDEPITGYLRFNDDETATAIHIDATPNIANVIARLAVSISDDIAAEFDITDNALDVALYDQRK